MKPYDNKTLAILERLAGFGALAVADIAGAHGLTVAAAASRLRRLVVDGLIESVRLLHGAPALFVITRRGLQAAGRPDLAPPRVSSSGFAHLLECGRVALALERALGGAFEVHSERELRVWERACGAPLASAEIGFGPGGARELHRPDLVCWPTAETRATLPIAVEVELTVKAPQRLREIVRAWARSRRVAAVVYYGRPPVLRALERAVGAEQAGARVHVIALARAGEMPVALGLDRSTRPVPRAP